MLPAHAGMILFSQILVKDGENVTRTRGDDPSMLMPL